VCGTNPTIHALVDYEAFCGVRGEGAEAETQAGVDPLGFPVFSGEEFRERRAAGEALELLDVREPFEYQIVRIPGAKLFPLSQLPGRLHELDSARTYVIHCHHGTRSRQAGLLMRQSGFRRVCILEGGVDAWAERIDPSLPRY
jgi:adenylyltransferase/sulfurtransferase